MILKKPYAFLIKHFKAIHLFLGAVLTYLIFRTGLIVNFFQTYIKANYYTSEVNLPGIYINIFMYLAIVFALFLSFAVYFLMKQKEKDTKFYFFIIFYYILLLVAITFCYSILQNIESATLGAQVIRVYRDISFIFYLPQFFFTGYSFLRGIGFDIKKFNFESDAKELEITDLDSEEFELTFGKDSYKYKRKIRRFIREFKYYVLENKLSFTILSSICVVIVGVLLYLNFGVYHKTYRETSKINHNHLVVQVMDSVLTPFDSGGKTIDGKYYLAIAFKIKNTSTKDTALDYENFKLEVSKRKIAPTLDRSSYFPLLGIGYTRDTTILAGSEATYVIPYEIDESFLNQKIVLKILDSLTYEIGSITPIYKTVNLNYDKILNNKEIRTVNKGKILELSKTLLGLTQVQINDVKTNSSYEYQYRLCKQGICQDLKDRVVASQSKKLLILNRMFTMDEYTNYYMAKKGSGSFVNDFVTIKYKDTEIKPKDVTPKNLKDYWLFEVPEDYQISNSELLITICGEIYKMKLDGSE